MSWTWAVEQYDMTLGKYAYFITCWGLYYFAVHFRISELWAFILVFMIGFLKEVFDAAVETDSEKFYNDPGFSWADLLYDSLGIITAFIFDVMVPPHIRPTDDTKNIYDEVTVYDTF